MNPVCDYHIHTKLCGHAWGEPDEYARQAVSIGLEEIGFSDHAPLVSHDDPSITMSLDELSTYHRMVEDVRNKFQDRLQVKIGIEADFIPGYEKQTRSILESYPYDYVIGSVHFIKDWAFDDPKEIRGWDDRDTDEIYRQYYDSLQKSAASRLFNVMAHVDLVKKFGHRPKTDMLPLVKKTADVFKAANVAIEINTSGLRKPVQEIYPAFDALSVYAKAGVPLTFGSDAHRPDEVGRDFDKAIDLAKAAGYKEYVTFSKRKIDKRIPILGS